MLAMGGDLDEAVEKYKQVGWSALTQHVRR
jgi:hypothetical protein